jgi:hypothetical protein
MNNTTGNELNDKFIIFKQMFSSIIDTVVYYGGFDSNVKIFTNNATSLLLTFEELICNFSKSFKNKNLNTNIKFMALYIIFKSQLNIETILVSNELYSNEYLRELYLYLCKIYKALDLDNITLDMLDINGDIKHIKVNIK